MSRSSEPVNAIWFAELSEEEVARRAKGSRRAGKTPLEPSLKEQGKAQAERGIEHPEMRLLVAGTRIFRVCDSDRASSGVLGGWWFGRETFFGLRKRLHNEERFRALGKTFGFRQVARESLAMLESYGQANAIAMTDLRADTLVWAGKGKRVGKFSFSKEGPGLAEESLTGAYEVTQFYIPGLVEPDKTESGKVIYRRAELFKAVLGSPHILATRSFIDEMETNHGLW